MRRILSETHDRLRRKDKDSDGMWKGIGAGHSIVAKAEIMPSSLWSCIKIEYSERKVLIQDKTGDVPSGNAKPEVPAQITNNVETNSPSEGGHWSRKEGRRRSISFSTDDFVCKAATRSLDFSSRPSFPLVSRPRQ